MLSHGALTVFVSLTYQRSHDDVLGSGSGVPFEAIFLPLPLEKVGESDAEAERVLVIDRNDVRKRPCGAIDAFELSRSSFGRERRRKTKEIRVGKGRYGSRRNRGAAAHKMLEYRRLVVVRVSFSSWVHCSIPVVAERPSEPMFSRRLRFNETFVNVEQLQIVK